MTLLLTAMNPVAIHQSSDYRLTDLNSGKAIEDSAGAKQISFGGMDFAAQISFTGVAAVGGLSTRELISKLVASGTKASEIEGIVTRLIEMCTAATKGLPPEKRFLTVLLAVTKEGRLPRVFLLSNADRPDGPRLVTPLEILERHEIVASSPRTLICGFTDAVSITDRRLLRQLSQSGQPTPEIQAALAEINKRAAAKSRGWISPECMVGSLLADGTRSSQNVGSAPGIPDAFVGGTNIAEFVKRHFRAAPGKKITLVQSAGRFSGQRSRSEPMPLEVGEPREISYSAPATAMKFAVNGTPGPSVELDRVNGTAKVRKNAWVASVFNTVTFRIDPTRQYSGLPISVEWVQLPNVPTVDGAQPRNWNYHLTLTIDKDRNHTLSISQNSMAFRSVNCPAPLPVLGPNEELVMVAPTGQLLLTASSETPTATGQIQGRFLLRDFPELDALPPIRLAGKKIGRNVPCPCGSGKKYKKCCGRV